MTKKNIITEMLEAGGMASASNVKNELASDEAKKQSIEDIKKLLDEGKQEQAEDKAKSDLNLKIGEDSSASDVRKMLDNYWKFQ